VRFGLLDTHAGRSVDGVALVLIPPDATAPKRPAKTAMMITKIPITQVVFRFHQRLFEEAIGTGPAAAGRAECGAGD